MGKKSSQKDESKRADRKFEKKLEFYTKVRETVALGAQKTIKKKQKLRSRQKKQEKLKAYNLSSLAEFLPDLETTKQPTTSDFKVTSKSRQKLVMKESSQLKTVLNHPVFKADPLAALHQHLQSTQPVVEKPERKSETGKKGTKKKRIKKKGSKALSGTKSMEE